MVDTINDINNLHLKPRFKMINWLIHSLEGFQSKIYKDLAGNLTIGYGHEIIGSIEEDLGLKFLNLPFNQLEAGFTEPLGQRLLAYDIFYRANIDNHFKSDLHDHTWVALTSFCFNIGESKFKQSDTFKFMYTHNYHQAADALCSWREANGHFCEGIAKRRLCEALILLQKPLNIHSPILPSKQLESVVDMPYMDENWLKLSSEHKTQVIELYRSYMNLYQTNL